MLEFDKVYLGNCIDLMAQIPNESIDLIATDPPYKVTARGNAGNSGGMLKNHNLAKHIASASWSEFFRQLQYKCDRQGKNLIRIGRFEPSSKMCLCGYINKDLTLKDREWDCPQCGQHNDRDLLAAVNIKRFGLQKQNLIGEISPVVNGAGDVEPLTLVGAVKRQYIKV